MAKRRTLFTTLRVSFGLSFLLAALPATLLAAPAAETCFDFSSVIKEPLGKILPLPKAKGKSPAKDISNFGKLSKGNSRVWSAGRGIVELPIREVYTKLLEHYTIKDPKKAKVRTYIQEQPGYLDFHLVMINAHPAPMVHLEWEENWGYALTDGTRENPKKIVISWQKVNGTQFIQRLCGSIVIEAVGPAATDVFLYEELEATGQRSGADGAKGHLGTLATLRRPGIQKPEEL